MRVQHLSTENRYLRERVRMVESQMQPLLSELSEKVRAKKANAPLVFSLLTLFFFVLALRRSASSYTLRTC